MADLTVIVPTRGRPAAAEDLVDAFLATCTADTRLVFSIDENDPNGAADVDLAFASAAGVVTGPNANMVEALNRAAATVDGYAVGFMGDDHRPRTRGWDQAYLDALRELGTGIVYGNDLLQGENIPTQVAMTADIVRALGYMAPSALTHLFVDNFWRDLGARAGCLRYLPDVVVEHLHPVAGKAAWDDGYARVNDPGMYARDNAVYRAYDRALMGAAVAEVKALRSAG